MVGGCYFIFVIELLINVMIGSEMEFIVLIQDNELMVFVALVDFVISFSYVGSFNFGMVAEIVVYDLVLQCFFFINFEENILDVVDFFNLVSFFIIIVIDMVFYGGGINFVVVVNGIVVVVLEGNEVIDNGFVMFWDVDGNLLSQVEVGLLFDMLIFILDGIKVLMVNEGEFNVDYIIDFEGFVSIIDLSVGVFNFINVNVIIISFVGFNDNEVSFKDVGVCIFGLGVIVVQDFEFEFIVINEIGILAYVNCQENNVLVFIDIEFVVVLVVILLGYKDWMEEGIVLDVFNCIDDIFFVNWLVKGMY